MNSFFAMGGYAAYVWPAYALSLAALLGAVAVTFAAEARARRRLAALASSGAERR